MRKKILNNLNLKIFDEMINKKISYMFLLEYKKNINNKIIDVFDDFIQEEENILSDPMLNFSDSLLDDDYFIKIYPGFGPDGWDLLEILKN